jgi:hypothetical protein
LFFIHLHGPDFVLGKLDCDAVDAGVDDHAFAHSARLGVGDDLAG